jgi:hypothetical protein
MSIDHNTPSTAVSVTFVTIAFWRSFLPFWEDAFTYAIISTIIMIDE